MAISSPQRAFASLNVADLQKKLGELSEIVEGAARPGTDIDVAALGAAIDAKQDPVLSCAFERVSQEYARFRGDSESLAPRATTIRSKDIKTVMSMLIESKRAVAAIDTDGDGQLSRQEVLEARHDFYADAGREIASGAAFGGNLAQEKALAAWLNQTPRSKEELSHRKSTYGELQRQVSLTKSTPEGKRALTAHLQKFLLNQTSQFHTGVGHTAGVAMRRTLKSAERNFLVRLFGISKLDNAEIAKLVGTPDLEGYAKSVDASVQSQFGASFAEVWLEGKDMNPANGTGFRFQPLPS